MPTKRGRRIIYARPSFLEGMARVFDLGGTLNEYDFGPRDQERAAVADDDKRESVAATAAADGRESVAADDGRARDDVANFWEDDIEAMRSVWQAVGDDMRAVMGDWRYVSHCPDCKSEDAHGEEAVPDAHWEGPLPPPDMLRQYEDLVPGSAERIFRMAEEQAKHRMEMENRRIKG